MSDIPNMMVGHRVLLRSERIVLLRSFKEHNVLLRSFFEFLATYETQKNAKNATFFCKERKRMQRTQRSFAKNVKYRMFSDLLNPLLISYF